ncbi:MAG: FtsQ-type POTRA domain-containing protein [Clostridia bacterium]|nr:FtsQ-type POTRA domain-containing protein [Clostridia bacterium]
MKTQEINNNKVNEHKKNKKRKKNFKRLFFWIKFILITALLVTTIVLLALSPLFNITRVEVKGSQRYEQGDIISTSGVIIGNNGFKTIGSNIKNFFTFRYGNAEEEILKTYPYIKSVIVRFIVPGKVRISITERKPEAVVESVTSNLIIDNEAYVLETIGKKVIKGMPLIKGLKFSSFEIGKSLNIADSGAYKDAFRLINQVKELDNKGGEKLYNHIYSIDVADRQKIRASIDSRITVNFGNLNFLEYRLDFCKHILFTKLGKEDKGYLDMTTEKPSFTPG